MYMIADEPTVVTTASCASIGQQIVKSFPDGTLLEGKVQSFQFNECLIRHDTGLLVSVNVDEAVLLLGNK
jgi:hypothetical protein